MPRSDRPPAIAIIGWREYIDLPQWEIRGLKAKVDTGARTSALHVEDLKILAGDRVSFSVVLDLKRPRKIAVRAPISRRGRVTSSSGHSTKRIFVKTDLVLGGRRREIEISLVDRGELSFRLLLGRMAIDQNFLIDVHQSYVTRRKKATRRKSSKPKKDQ